MKHDFADGKYTVINDNGVLKALRNGEEWRDLTGDNLIYWMLCAVDQLKTENAALKAQAANANLHSLQLTPHIDDLNAAADDLMAQAQKAMLNLSQQLQSERPDHMARLCNLAHSAVTLMTLPPFERDNYDVRQDGLLELAKDKPATAKKETP